MATTVNFQKYRSDQVKYDDFCGKCEQHFLAKQRQNGSQSSLHSRFHKKEARRFVQTLPTPGLRSETTQIKVQTIVGHGTEFGKHLFHEKCVQEDENCPTCQKPIAQPMSKEFLRAFRAVGLGAAIGLAPEAIVRICLYAISSTQIVDDNQALLIRAMVLTLIATFAIPIGRKIGPSLVGSETHMQVKLFAGSAFSFLFSPGYGMLWGMMQMAVRSICKGNDIPSTITRGVGVVSSGFAIRILYSQFNRFLMS